MYTIAYYAKRTVDGIVYEEKYPGEDFRVKKNALHFLRKELKERYIENGYTVEDVKNGINCYKSKINTKGLREAIETRVRIEKM